MARGIIARKSMDLVKRIKLIISVKKSNLPREDKKQIIKILRTNSLEKGLPLILQVLGTALEVFKFFSQ